MAVFPGLSGWAGARRNLLLDFMVQETDTPTVLLGATPSRLISDPPPSSPHFYAGCPSCGNHPNLSWLVTGTKYAGLHMEWRGWNQYNDSLIWNRVENVNLKCKTHKTLGSSSEKSMDQVAPSVPASNYAEHWAASCTYSHAQWGMAVKSVKWTDVALLTYLPSQSLQSLQPFRVCAQLCYS